MTQRPTRARAARRALAGTALVLLLGLAACTAPDGRAGGGSGGDPSPTGAEPGDDEASETPSQAPPSGDEESEDDAALSPERPRSHGPTTYVRGLPDGARQAPENVTAGAGRSASGELVLVVFGSSSCPEVIGGVEIEGSTASVTLDQLGGPMCTRDYVPTTSMREVEGIGDVSEITLGERGALTLPAEAGEIAWLEAEG